MLSEPPTPQRRRARRPDVLAALRPVFATSGTTSFLAFAVIGLFPTLVPTYTATLSGSTNLLLGGAAVALVLVCSALAQLAGHGKPARRPELGGLPLSALGLVLPGVAGGVSSPTLLLVATAIAGIGQGLAYLGRPDHDHPGGPGRSARRRGLRLPHHRRRFPCHRQIGFLSAVRYFAHTVAAACTIRLLAHLRRGRVTDRDVRVRKDRSRDSIREWAASRC
ncbi:hypothetical protein [Embleya hyalina]|uniref:MFS transporter n=1 Tax=Embleya hyalina TaxID=516124 RepID=A0A401YQS9_9ACTN|nr:hypothetical protein [Embleya hyalina]GCD96968.1 hypothetical protein EHYA_04655 [Embleya hyalina]